MNKPICLLYLTAEEWPTFRADLRVLFGKYLPRLGVMSDLLTDQASSGAESWPGGLAYLKAMPASRARFYLSKFVHQCVGLWRARTRQYDAIQVRDQAVMGAVALCVARWRGLPFYYWMSFPQAEGQIARARGRGPSAGFQYWFPLMQGIVGKWLLYRFVLPRADHVFVQSEQMKRDLMARRIDPDRMTPVPMGVDLEATSGNMPVATDPRLAGRRVVAYLGTLDAGRKIEVLFSMLARLRPIVPEILLVLVGDAEDAIHRAWLKSRAVEEGVDDLILWTGWLPTREAWAYVAAAEVGISPFPRGFLLDSASPTKAVEYMALGLPVLVNDNPDQKQIVSESGGGLCRPLEPAAFAEALLALLNAPEMRHEMGQKGRAYVRQHRSYAFLATQLASKYRELLP